MKNISAIVICFAISSLATCMALQKVVVAPNSPDKKITALDVSNAFQVEISQGELSSAESNQV